MTEDQLMEAMGLRNMILDLKDHRKSMSKPGALEDTWPHWNQSRMLPQEMLDRHQQEILDFLDGEILALQEQIEII